MTNYIDINLLVSKLPHRNFDVDPYGQIFTHQPEVLVNIPKINLINTQEIDIQEKTEVVIDEPVLSDGGEYSRVSKFFKKLSVFLLGMGMLSFSAVIFPQVSEFIDEKLSSSYAQVFTKPTKDFGDSLMASGDKEVKRPYQPIKDVTLSRENSLVIDEIGVDAKLNESVAEDVEEALREGVWRVSEFGTPYGRKRPTILAAHRFGFLEWTNDFRRKNSFYNLPKLDEGDTVEVIWNQRRYVYEVYQVEEGVEILDYQADLILYTCKFLDSETRIFVYARLLEI